MRIDVGNFVITGEENNIIVSTKKTMGEDTKKPGEEYLTNHAYYSKFESACLHILRQGIRLADAQDLQELRQAVIDAEMRIIEAIKERRG